MTFTESRGPVVLPVNFRTLGSDIVVRAEPDATELDLMRGLGNVPWAGGERSTFVRIVSDEVTGRRIRRLEGAEGLASVSPVTAHRA